MTAHILINLLNKLGKIDILDLQYILILFSKQIK